MIKHIHVRAITIFLLSLVLGVLGALQYSSLKEKDAGFQENQPIREIRTLLESNKELSNTVKETKKTLESLSSQEQVFQNAEKQISNANNFSGETFAQDASAFTLLVEGEITPVLTIKLLNILWNSGVENIKINGVSLKTNSAGIDQSGGQVLVGGTPVSTPLVLSLYGNKEKLFPLLNPQQGALKSLQTNNKLSITLSEQ